MASVSRGCRLTGSRSLWPTGGAGLPELYKQLSVSTTSMRLPLSRLKGGFMRAGRRETG